MPKVISEVGRWGRRVYLQLAGLLAFNGYFWRAPGKYLCVPVLNCYSCPVGTIACPIGTLSRFMVLHRIPFYVLGLLGMIGLAVGRAFCGWACPFGFLQDALYRIRSWKWRMPRVFDRLKYALLAVLVLALPFVIRGESKQGAVGEIAGESTGVYSYCALLCPAGTLEASVPNLAQDAQVRAAASWRTWSKMAILAGVLGLVVVARRGFCRALCPLGALMAFTSRIALLQLRTDAAFCTRCMKCVRVCPTDARRVPTPEAPTEATAECVMCLDCVRNCPEKSALAACLGGRPVSVSQEKSRD